MSSSSESGTAPSSSASDSDSSASLSSSSSSSSSSSVSSSHISSSSLSLSIAFFRPFGFRSGLVTGLRCAPNRPGGGGAGLLAFVVTLPTDVFMTVSGLRDGGTNVDVGRFIENCGRDEDTTGAVDGTLVAGGASFGFSAAPAAGFFFESSIAQPSTFNENTKDTSSPADFFMISSGTLSMR